MFLRAVTALVVFGLLTGPGRLAISQTFPVVAPQTPSRESNSQESDRLRRINEQLEIRRSQFQLRSRNELAANQAATRSELDRVTRLRDGAAGFLTGQVAAANLVGMSELLEQVGHLPSVVAALQASVPPLTPDDFVQQAWGEVVEPDGRLTRPPRFMRVVDGYAGLQEEWSSVAVELRQERGPSDEELLALEEAVASLWDGAGPAIRSARAADGRDALAWLNRVGLFLRDLDGDQLDDLGGFLRSRGHTFAGGSVGELLNHLIEHRLNLRPGRAGHAVLAAAGAVILAEADADIAILEDRMEYYRQQDDSGGNTQPGRPIYRSGGSVPDTRTLPRRDIVVPASQPPTAPGRNVAVDMR